MGTLPGMNLPNAITLARIALVPVFLWLSYQDSNDAAIAAFVVFLVASLSDFVDGYLARRNGTISRMGEFLDPFADKLLVGAALVVLFDTRGFPLWVALLIGGREIAVQVLRTQIVHGGGTLPASSFGKVKTVLQIAMVGWWLLPWESVNAGHWILLASCLFATLWSGGEYFVAALRDRTRVAE
jgi:CDP-diacylglycerol---glycerol-3-phosphate 3-phosphatidyltransferase